MDKSATGARRAQLMAMYDAMAARFSPCNWWPGNTPFEVAVGAVLTQNTSWSNVDMALDRLRRRDALRPGPLWAMPVQELEECLKPSGFFRLKAKRLRNFLSWLASHPGWDSEPGAGRFEVLRHKDGDTLRRELLAVNGIGPETADSILLYALDRPSFVVDAYTRRLFSRHALVPECIAYEPLRAFFMEALAPDRALYNEYHALIVNTGKEFCRKRRPLCGLCPLGNMLDTTP